MAQNHFHLETRSIKGNCWFSVQLWFKLLLLGNKSSQLLLHINPDVWLASDAQNSVKIVSWISVLESLQMTWQVISCYLSSHTEKNPWWQRPSLPFQNLPQKDFISVSHPVQAFVSGIKEQTRGKNGGKNQLAGSKILSPRTKG